MALHCPVRRWADNIHRLSSSPPGALAPHPRGHPCPHQQGRTSSLSLWTWAPLGPSSLVGGCLQDPGEWEGEHRAKGCSCRQAELGQAGFGWFPLRKPEEGDTGLRGSGGWTSWLWCQRPLVPSPSSHTLLISTWDNWCLTYWVSWGSPCQHTRTARYLLGAGNSPMSPASGDIHP